MKILAWIQIRIKIMWNRNTQKGRNKCTQYFSVSDPHYFDVDPIRINLHTDTHPDPKSK